MLIGNVTIGSTAVLSYYFNVVFIFACLCMWHQAEVQGLINWFFSLIKFENYFNMALVSGYNTILYEVLYHNSY